MQEEPGKKENEIEEKSAVGEDVRILLVDDNPKVLKLLEKGLKKEGFEVAGRTSPVEAVEELKQNGYTILISDDHMKEMSGLSLSKKARQIRPDMKIIILTGMLRKEIIEAGQVKLIDDYIAKPIPINKLIEKINMIKEKS